MTADRLSLVFGALAVFTVTAITLITTAAVGLF